MFLQKDKIIVAIGIVIIFLFLFWSCNKSKTNNSQAISSPIICPQCPTEETVCPTRLSVKSTPKMPILITVPIPPQYILPPFMPPPVKSFETQGYQWTPPFNNMNQSSVTSTPSDKSFETPVSQWTPPPNKTYINQLSEISTTIPLWSILIMGDYSAANYQESVSTSTNAKVFNNGIIFQNATDPLPGSDGVEGSIWTRVVSFSDPAKLQIMLIPTAVGGASINRWIPSANDLFLNVTKQVNGYKATGGTITHVLWQHGESDNTMDPNDYKAKFILLADAINTLTNNAKIYVARSSYCNGNSNPGLIDVQTQLGLMYNQGPSTDDIQGFDYRYKDCFYKTIGNGQISTRWAKSLGLMF